MKARIRQLHSELKTSKKGSRSISEYVLCVQAIAVSLMDVGDPIYERGQVDAILQGLVGEYNPFFMMVYSKAGIMDIYDMQVSCTCKNINLTSIVKNYHPQVP